MTPSTVPLEDEPVCSGRKRGRKPEKMAPPELRLCVFINLYINSLGPFNFLSSPLQGADKG